jgi:DNA-binding MarR family transcriptional regulator
MTNKINDSGNNLPSDYSIWGLYADTMELISRARTMELIRYGLTREQSHILRILYDAKEPLTINEIISHVMRAHNSVSAIIKRMERNDLVRRIKVTDNRQYKISMTPKGRKLFENMPVNSITMAFSALSKDDKKTLISSLQKLDDKVRSMLGLDYTPPFLK